MSSLDLTHSNGGNRSWTFNWTAPSATGTQNFYAIAVAADLSGDESGDSWNWYGGAVNTPYAISVSSTAGVGDEMAGTWLAPATPNPMFSRTQLTFAMAKEGSAKLEVLDASGRRVATLADGLMPAGQRSVTWNGMDAAGNRLHAGLYFVRLRTASETHSIRVMLLQ